MRSDVGGCHAAKISRGPVEGAEFPPGVTCHEGHPQSASPFLQALLPLGFTCEGRKSKAVSFKSDTMELVRGTSRTYDQAKMSVLSWSWSWFNNLPIEQRSALTDAAGAPSTPLAKRRKV